MKRVNYRGGVVTFVLPDNWIETIDPEDEAGIYYPDTADAGTLRLYITTARSPNPVSLEMVAKLMPVFAPDATEPVETLVNGNLLLHFRQHTEEEEPPRVIFFWLIGNLVPPDTARIANFSYTVPEPQADLPATEAVLAFLDAAVRSAVFASELGQ
jgi:hypothetical protein